ncbi:MAG: HAMP domain-containing histidine kinase [Cyanobacteria bacterium RM1_2_2]|nr:HAMP domain-containing histidine kinase [Cyanobacteria bacterium RM1_2_2]
MCAQFPAQQRVRAERQWSGAVAALNQLLQRTIESDSPTLHSPQDGSPVQALLLSGPFPVLQSASWTEQVASWVFTVGSPGEVLQLLPAAEQNASLPWKAVATLPLRPDDPLAAEQFCVALTPEFSLAMTLGETASGAPSFLFSFDPEVVWQVWRALQARLKLTAPQLATTIHSMVKQFTPVVPDYRIVTQFSRLILANLPEPLEWDKRPAGVHSLEAEGEHHASARPLSVKFADRFGESTPEQATRLSASLPEDNAESEKFTVEKGADTELLQAIAHEVRTPLTTIRTLTRLLLKRKDLNPDVMKRLEIIDRECTEQIDRFSLIFRAVELETMQSKSALMPLAPISLSQVIQQNLTRWQQQASQHSHTLDILLPQKLPMVVTDPTMLDQVLTGLIDRITHQLPPGSHIQVQVTPAGHQLKLQFRSQPQAPVKEGKTKLGFAPAVRSIGQLLMFQPETGNLSLSLPVTKNLFQALGGKLIVREHPQQGEVLTIFLPLETRKSED